MVRRGDTRLRWVLEIPTLTYFYFSKGFCLSASQGDDLPLIGQFGCGEEAPRLIQQQTLVLIAL